MKKEILIVCIILIIIIIINITCQKYLSKVIDDLTPQLDNIAQITKQYLNDENTETINKTKQQIHEIEERWRQYKKNLSLYIEHDELEKVDTSIVRIRSYISIDNYEEVVPETKECIFILEHIKEKEKISLANLF